MYVWGLEVSVFGYPLTDSFPAKIEWQTSPKTWEGSQLFGYLLSYLIHGMATDPCCTSGTQIKNTFGVGYLPCLFPGGGGSV